MGVETESTQIITAEILEACLNAVRSREMSIETH